MKATVALVLSVLYIANSAKGTLVDKKEKRGLFGFGFGYAAPPVTAVVHHHYGAPVSKVAYTTPVTKVAYAETPVTYVEPVTKVTLTPPPIQPVTYDVPTISVPSDIVPLAAPWPRVVYPAPSEVTKVTYAASPVTKVISYSSQSPFFTKYAYAAAPGFKKFKQFSYGFSHY